MTKNNGGYHMPITSDYHMHSSYSFDSEEKMKNMIEASIQKGLKSICFTEHMDIGGPVTEEWPEHAWEVNVDSYLYDLINTRADYDGQIEVNFGLELGLQQAVFRENAICAKAHEFDFIIGSIHFVNGMDTYWPEFFEGKTAKQAVVEYYRTMLANVKQFNNFDVLGHMDYIVRTLPGGEAVYVPNDYTDLTDEILETLIEKEKGIEINTSQLKKGFTMANPCLELLKRYKELGGEIITVGSDAHKAEHVAYGFDKAEEFLKSAGFKYYSTFKERVASFHKL